MRHIRSKLFTLLGAVAALSMGAAFADIQRYPSLGGGTITLTSVNAWLGTNSFEDADFSIVDQGDPAKRLITQLSGITTGNDALLTITGTAASPTVQFGTSFWYFNTAGTSRLLLDASGLGIGTLPIVGGAALGSTDAWWARDGAGTWQTGIDVNGAAVAQTIKAHDGITGTDIAGANFTLAGGRGTGAGAGGNLIDQTAVTLGTGTTAQTLADRRVVVAKPKALTAAAATAVVQIGVPQATVAGGTIEYTIRANDGTNFQSRSGVLVYSAVNVAGTEVCTISRPDGGATVDNTTDSAAVSSGTLTNTFTCTTGLTDVVQIAANAASSLTETVLQITYEIRRNEGSGVITPQ